MRDYRIRIRLRSPIGTPWQSDTLFGHLAWHVAHGRTNMTIEEFLQPFREGCPPFVLSDGFPDELLPRPFLPILSDRPSTTQDYALAKRREKAQFVTQEDFQNIRRGDVTNWRLVDDPWQHFELLHASINRFTGTTTGPETEEDQVAEAAGHLFPTRLAVPRGEDRTILPLSIYLRAEDPWGKLIPDMLAEMAPLGYGRDRSTGTGAFELIDVQPFDGFASLPVANGFVSLSSYCPARHDPTRGRWKIRLKYGKLGENAGGGNPFKRPLIQFEPGAVFLTDCPPKPYYGRAVEGIAPGMPEAIQCCFTLAVPCLIPEDLAEVFPLP